MSSFQDFKDDNDEEFIEFDEDFDVDAMSEGEGDDEEEEPGEFETLVMNLCGQRIAENELLGRVETEDEVFQAVMGSTEIANYMVSAGAIQSADDHANANDTVLKGVSQQEVDRAKTALANSSVQIIAYTGEQAMRPSAQFADRCTNTSGRHERPSSAGGQPEDRQGSGKFRSFRHKTILYR